MKLKLLILAVMVLGISGPALAAYHCDTAFQDTCFKSPYPSDSVWFNPQGIDLYNTAKGAYNFSRVYYGCGNAGTGETEIDSAAYQGTSATNTTLQFICGANTSTGYPKCNEGQFCVMGTYIKTHPVNFTLPVIGITASYIIGLPNLIPTCSFSALPLSGPSPLAVTFQDTSTPSTTSRTWIITLNGTGTTFTSTNYSWVQSLVADGHYDVNLTAANPYGTCAKFTPRYIQVNSTNPYVDVEIRDSVSGSFIQHAGVGIYDYTHLVWRNTTADTGIVYYDSTGASYEYPLYVGETVRLAAWAAGFQTLYRDLTIQYNGQWHQPNAFQMPLVKNASLPDTGNATIQVNVVSNLDGGPLDGAYCLLTNNNLLYGVSKLTTGGGSATFANIPAGDDYELLVTKTGYNSVTMFTDAPADVVTTIDISMVPEGYTPTPTGTLTITPTGTGTYDDRPPDEKIEDIADDFVDFMPGLIALFVLATIVTVLRKMG